VTTTIKALSFIGGPYHGRRELIGNNCPTEHRKKLGILVGCDISSNSTHTTPWAYTIIGPDQAGNLIAISVALDV
jgi:hypothetical protein